MLLPRTETLESSQDPDGTTEHLKIGGGWGGESMWELQSSGPLRLGEQGWFRGTWSLTSRLIPQRCLA